MNNKYGLTVIENQFSLYKQLQPIVFTSNNKLQKTENLSNILPANNINNNWFLQGLDIVDGFSNNVITTPICTIDNLQVYSKIDKLPIVAPKIAKQNKINYQSIMFTLMFLVLLVVFMSLYGIV